MTNFARVISAQSGRLTVEGDDGRTYTVTGSRNLRNNNPGNIEAGSYANSLGAIGSDGRFAVFPSYAAGQAAQHELQFNSAGYAGKTIQSAIDKYAPPSENDSRSYAAAVARAVGVPVTTPLASLNAAQRAAYLVAQQNIEGSNAAVLRDSDGVQLPPANIPGPDPVTPLLAPAAYGINSSGSPDERSLDPNYQPASSLSIPLAPLPADAGAPVGSALTGQYLTGDGGLGYGAPSLPMASAAATSAAAPAAPAAPPTNAKGYVIGQTYKLPDGASYEANADGSFTKTANTPRPMTAIQLALLAAEPGAMQNLNNTVNGAKNLAGDAQGALATAGSFLGNLFSSGGASSSPDLPIASSAAYNPTTEDERNALLAAPAGDDASALTNGLSGADSLAFNPDVLSFTPSLNAPDQGYTGPGFDAVYDPAPGMTMPAATPNSAANFGVKNASGSPDDRSSTSILPMAAARAAATPTPAGYNATTQSQRNAILATPPSMFYYDPGTGQGNVALPAGARPNVTIPSDEPQAVSLPIASSTSASHPSTSSPPSYSYNAPSASSHGSDEDTSSLPILQSQSYAPATANGYVEPGSAHGGDETDGADLKSISSSYTIPASAVPKYIDVATRVQVPGVDPAGDAESGIHWDDATGQFVLGDQAAVTPAPTYKTVTVSRPNPAYHPARTVTVSHPIMQAAAPLAPQAIASTNGYTYLPNGSGGYNRVGVVNPSLTPAQQYAQAAAPALKSQPDGSRPTYSGVSPGGSLTGV